MIVDFKAIQHDFYDKVEQPVLTLKTPDGRIISTLSNYYELKPTFRFNDVSEVNFIVPAYYNGERNNGYDEIYGMRLVEVEPYGDFILVNPKKNNEGGKKEIKTCKAYSLEYAFNYKKVDIPAGTYNFYNPINNDDTILHMIIELMPDWSIGEVDKELIGRWRTFDSVDDGLYAFMMNTLQESYNCIFLFDTFNKRINVKAANRSANNLPIYLSYDNLIKSVDITELSEDVVTALSGFGSGEEVNIRTVNPNGTNTIYNLDYFISKGDIAEALADKWNRYNETLELYQSIFSNLKILLTQKQNDEQLATSKLIVLTTERDAIDTEYLTALTNQNVNADYDVEISNLKTQLDTKNAEIDEQNIIITNLKGEIASINDQIIDVVTNCKITSYFTEEEVKTLSQYFKHDSIVDDTFVIPEYSSAIIDDESNRIEVNNQGKIKISGVEVYAQDIAKVFAMDENGIYQAYTVDEESGETIYNGANLDLFNDIELPENVAETVANQLNDDARKKSYMFRGGIFEFTHILSDKNVSLTGDVVEVRFHYNTDNLITYIDENSSDLTKIGHFVLTATLHNAEYNGTAYPSMNFSIQGKLSNNIPQTSDEFISLNIDSAIFYITGSNTDYQKQAIVQDLYDFTKESLDKLAFPSYEFSVDSANFIFAKEFAPFKDQLELGSTINLTLDDNEDNILQPILIEIGLNYDDETDFSIVFSNKYRSSTSQFQLADLLTEMNRQTGSTTKNKADYKAAKDSKLSDKVSDFTSSAIDVIKNKIINSSNQSIEWNSSGMFFRKLLPGGGFADKQIGIINENIVFTKDGWDSAEIAIGAYSDPNLGEGYGIIAPSIFGTLVAGENLQFRNDNKQFIFDQTGAWLHNSSLAFTQEEDPNTGYKGGKLLIDPRYGIAAGNASLFNLKDDEENNKVNIEPSFIDDEGNIIWDENEVVVTAEGSKYYVPLNTQFYFDINTGNAYFSGTINGKNIVAETINGLAIAPGTLSGATLINGTVDAGSKLTGSVATEQLSKNIIAAMNKYVEMTEDADLQKVDVKLIGNLSADNFIGGKIIANDSLLTQKLIVNGESAKLAILPEYGIVGGNTNLFDVDSEGNLTNPTFVSANGELILDEATGAPVNSSFYFDINTGEAYFTGPLNTSQIKTAFAKIEDAFITNAQIKNLSADKINAGSVAANVMQANIIGALQGHFGSIDVNNLEAEQLQAYTASIDGLLTAGKIIADEYVAKDINATKYITGVRIHGDLIDANTIKANSLKLLGSDGLYREINADALTEAEFAKIIDETDEGMQPSVYEGIHGASLIKETVDGSVLVVDSVTTDKVRVTDLSAFEADIAGLHLQEGAIYSGSKNSISADLSGFYLDKDGQMSIGDMSNHVKYYKDNGDWKLDISAKTITFGNGDQYQSIEEAVSSLQNDINNTTKSNQSELGDIKTYTHIAMSIDKGSTLTYMDFSGHVEAGLIDDIDGAEKSIYYNVIYDAESNIYTVGEMISPVNGEPLINNLNNSDNIDEISDSQTEDLNYIYTDTGEQVFVSITESDNTEIETYFCKKLGIRSTEYVKLKSGEDYIWNICDSDLNTITPTTYFYTYNIDTNEYSYKDYSITSDNITISEDEDIYIRFSIPANFDISSTYIYELTLKDIDKVINDFEVDVYTGSLTTLNSYMSVNAEDYVWQITDSSIRNNAENLVDILYQQLYQEKHTYYNVIYDSGLGTYTVGEEISQVEGTLLEGIFTTTEDQVYSGTSELGEVFYFCIKTEVIGDIGKIHTGIDGLQVTVENAELLAKKAEESVERINNYIVINPSDPSISLISSGTGKIDSSDTTSSSVRITNDKISFYKGNVEGAYIGYVEEERTSMATTASYVTEMYPRVENPNPTSEKDKWIGNFCWIARNNGHYSLKVVK